MSLPQDGILTIEEGMKTAEDCPQPQSKIPRTDEVAAELFKLDIDKFPKTAIAKLLLHSSTLELENQELSKFRSDLLQDKNPDWVLRTRKEFNQLTTLKVAGEELASACLVQGRTFAAMPAMYGDAGNQASLNKACEMATKALTNWNKLMEEMK